MTFFKNFTNAEYIYLVTALFLATPVLYSQVDRARLLGAVTDATGALISGADVKVTAVASGREVSKTTGQDGTYQLSNLPVGQYTIRIFKDGFSTEQIDRVELYGGVPRTVNVKLQVAALPGQQVTVTADATQTDQTSPEAGTVVQSQEIKNIPLNGRNFSGLVQLAPLATGSTTRDARFAGHAPDDNNLTLDGVDITGIQEHPQKANQNLTISTEAISEFHVSSTLFTADEGGAAAGGQINIVTKSGTNNFHGALFEYLRNSDFDARGPFDGATIPALHRNQFGANLGGPIQKDKTFFFASYETLREIDDTTQISTVPSALFRSQIAANSPALLPSINLYPKGTSPTSNPNADQLNVVSRTRYLENSFDGRVDHYFNDSTSMYARFDLDDSPTNAQDPFLFDQQTLIRQTNGTLQFQHSFSPRVVNQTQLGINRSAFDNPYLSPSPYEFDTASFTTLPQASPGDREIGTSIAGIDNLTMTFGRNTLKIGGEVRRIRLNQGVHAQDVITYASDQSLLNNQVNRFDFNSAEPFVGFRRTYYFSYVQDEFRMRPNLTFNLGLRYEYYTVPTEAHGRGTVFDLYGCHGFCAPGTPFYNSSPLDLDPRLGVAWSPSGSNGKTVVRAGFGVYHGDGQNDDLNAPLEDLETRFSLASTDIPTLSFPVSNFFGLASSSSITPRALQRNRHDLYNMATGISVQQQLPGQFVLQVGYFGNLGRRLFYRSYENVIDPSTGQRFLPGYGQIDMKYNEGNSNYNAMQVSLQRRFANGLLFNLQYAWSHSLNDGGVGGGEANSPQNVNCQQCDYGSSIDDVRHHLVIDSVYELPFGPGKRFLSNVHGIAGHAIEGWQLSGLLSAQSGLPFNVTVPRNATDTPDGNIFNQRPNYVAGFSPYPVGGSTIGQWLNPGAFAVPAVGAFGNLGANAFYGPSTWNLDLALQKSVNIWERAKLTLRGEAFNIFNHAEYNNPNSSVTDPLFGQITSANPARELQVALRLDF